MNFKQIFALCVGIFVAVTGAILVANWLPGYLEARSTERAAAQMKAEDTVNLAICQSLVIGGNPISARQCECMVNATHGRLTPDQAHLLWTTASKFPDDTNAMVAALKSDPVILDFVTGPNSPQCR